ncbi:phage tail protein [Paracoccus kondratievae]|uniref:C40 family peptidase n=1 Tax=Paracoccus kondratievae TaxID=135740 RepID=UPI0012667A8A|nr:NlpC/P60 family protein [Paracoccus kondratievae]QFQ88274.1 phage tail protein [Paracoccus kondratievae]
MSWSDRFIGIPYLDLGRTRAGCDCWGLACVIYREELGISLPEYLGDYASPDELAEVAALIDRDRASLLWVPVSGPAMAFDIALFRRGRWSSHVGIVIRHGLMIHMVADDHAKVQTYRDGPYKHRFQGHYRHVSRAVERPVQILSEARR